MNDVISLDRVREFREGQLSARKEILESYGFSLVHEEGYQNGAVRAKILIYARQGAPLYVMETNGHSLVRVTSIPVDVAEALNNYLTK